MRWVSTNMEIIAHMLPNTPVALGAPMLISLGHPKFESVVVLLLANTVDTVFRATGTLVCFGFGGPGLSGTDFVQILFHVALALVVEAYLLAPVILRHHHAFRNDKGELACFLF